MKAVVHLIDDIGLEVAVLELDSTVTAWCDPKANCITLTYHFKEFSYEEKLGVFESMEAQRNLKIEDDVND
jgi:hypothetical protein